MSQETIEKNMLTDADIEFKKRLQSLFVKSNNKKYDDIVRALEDGDVKLAHRLVHTLKGNAGQLGKNQLHQAAAEVERQLKDEKNLATPEQMAALKAELDVVLSQFAAIFPPQPGELSESEAKIQAEPREKLLNTESARELFGKLEPMLEMGNPKCLELVDSLRLIPGSEELIKQMDDFDFQKALVTLAELKKGGGIGAEG